MANRDQLLILFVAFIKIVQGSFWNEIPQRCRYDQTQLFACSNTTFVHAIPMFNDRTDMIPNHHIDIRHSSFELSLREMLMHVGNNIENLTLIDNQFTSAALQNAKIFEGGIFFRLLQSLEVRDDHGIQWLQLNGSYFPQLLFLDISDNRLTSKDRLVFDRQYYPRLLSLDLSHNRLKNLNNLIGTSLINLQRLNLAFNPLESISEHIGKFRSLTYLDVSATLVKHLFSLDVIPTLQVFLCQQCRQIPSWEYDTLLGNCSQVSSNQLTLDLSEANVESLKPFNPYMQCIRNLILNKQNLAESITSNDLLASVNLQSIEARENHAIDYVHLNVYDHLTTIDFSQNLYLNQVILRLRSNFTHLQTLNLSHTALTEFSVDFSNTNLKYLHIDLIDMSHARLESLEFLQYFTFYSLDLSYNRLKIVDIEQIHFRHGIYELNLMNLVNFSNNAMEYFRINWENESPHIIDLSDNQLETVEIHGQATYSLRLNRNPNLLVSPPNLLLDLPALKLLDLTEVRLQSMEYLIYLHNLSQIRTLILDTNTLLKDHRTLNWQVFYPWHQYLTHLSMRNMSLERIDDGINLNDYYHLLTIDLFLNDHLKCDCTLQPFLNWLRRPPPPLHDFYEPLQKLLRINCPVSLLDLHCPDDVPIDDSPGVYHAGGHHRFYRTIFILLFFTLILLVVLKMADRRLRYVRSRFYERVHTDANIITLNERHITQKPQDE